MQAEIEQLFTALQQSTDTEVVQQITIKLNELSNSPEFIQALSELSISSTNLVIKRAAIIMLSKEVNSHWGEIGELQEMIISTLPDLIKSFNNQYPDLVQYYVQVVIDNGIQTEHFTTIVSDIEQYLQEESSINIGLIYAKCVCSFICKYETEDEIFSSLTNPLIALLLAFIDSTENENILADLFTCFRSIILNSHVQFFNQNPDALQPILSKFLTLEEVTNTEGYKSFARSASDFITSFFQRYLYSIDGDTISTLVTLIMGLLSSGSCITYVRANLLSALYSIFQVDELFDSILESSGEELFTDVLFPQCEVTYQELSQACEDAKTFVDELHKASQDFNDYRETASLIIKHLASKPENDAVREIIFKILIDKIGEFGHSEETDQDIVNLFTAAFFFSSAADSYALYSKPLLTRLIAEVSPLFEHDNEIAKASGFLMISQVHAFLPVEIAACCINASVDDSHLVRYYAMTAAANLLEKIDDDEAAAEIIGQFEDSIDDMMSVFLEMCNEFDDANLKKCITVVVRFFGEQLLPLSSEICQQLITMIAESGQGDLSDDAALENMMEVNKSLANLVEMVSDRGDDVNEFAQSAFVLCIEALQAMTNRNAVDAFLETVFQILECCTTFPPEFWHITEAIAPHFAQGEQEDYAVGACCEVFSLLVLKDTEFAARAEVVEQVLGFVVAQMQQLMDRVDSWIEFAKLCEGIVCKLPADNPYLCANFQTLCEMTLHHLNTIDINYNDIDGAVFLMNALLINNFGGCQEALGDNFDTFLQHWVNWPVFPETDVALMQNFEALSVSPELQGAALHAVINQLFEDMLSKDVGIDEFDQDVERDGIVWFDFGDTLNGLNQFFISLQETHPDMFEEIKNSFDEEEFNDLVRLPEIAQIYIERRDSKIKE